MWLACQRASWEPRLPMRMGLWGLLCSLLIVLSRIRDERVVGSLVGYTCAISNRAAFDALWTRFPYEKIANCEPQNVFDFDGCSNSRNGHAGNGRSGTCRGHLHSRAEAWIFAAGGNAGFDADVDAACGNGA